MGALVKDKNPIRYEHYQVVEQEARFTAVKYGEGDVVNDQVRGAQLVVE